MSKLIIAGIIATSLTVMTGLIILLPVFLVPQHQTNVLLTIDINTSESLTEICNFIPILQQNNIPITFFISGKDAEENKNCLSNLPKNIVVGSKTYDNIILPTIDDYSIQLDEVQRGKQTIDSITHTNTIFFRSPQGITDDNIYSLLSKNGILGDFSYSDHYNKYYKKKFLRFDISAYNGTKLSEQELYSIVMKSDTMWVYFSGEISVGHVLDMINVMKKQHVNFVSINEMTGLGII